MEDSENLRVHLVDGVHPREVVVVVAALHAVSCIKGNDANAEAAMRRIARAGKGDVELAVREARFWEIETNAGKRLPLRLVDGHRKSQTNGELAAAEGERETGVGGLESDAGNHDLLPEELSGDDDALQYMSVDAGRCPP